MSAYINRKPPAFQDCFVGSGEMAARMRSFDWSMSPLGPAGGWPQSLKTTVRIMLTSRYAMWMAWGPDLTFLCNDAYAPTLGIKKDWALGSPAAKVWAEIWPDIGPRIEHVLKTGEATWDEGLLLFLERSGYPEETYHTFSYSPLADDAGSVSGMLCVVTEETERIIGERRLKTLRDVGTHAAAAKSVDEVCRLVVNTLGENAADVPFSLVYLTAPDGKTAHLRAASRLASGSPASPEVLELTGVGAERGWPLSESIAGAGLVRVTDIRRRFGDLSGGPWNAPPKEAVVIPLRASGQERVLAFLVAAVSACREFDEAYRGFFELVSGQAASGISNANAYEEERRRAEALQELDRAKTVFFSNVSHEFRTPLTLILGPLEDALARPMEAEDRSRVEMVHRNALRLQKLVNTLLDFSRIEAGRIRAFYQPTDLGGLTAELASVFRAAVERAGMRLVVDCATLSEPAYVDRDMWEKIVLNLISNAFKFTLEGEIRVSLREFGGEAILRVQDTGTGISQDQMPHIFERFHRVEGARARTHEGTGIGLALVQELAKLHSGSVEVESVFGEGATFIVRIPLGRAHLLDEAMPGTSAADPSSLGARHYVEEALRWLMNEDGVPTSAESSVIRDVVESRETTDPAAGRVSRPRIVLADDNADLRDYLSRILCERYDVEAVPDGERALEAIRLRPPELVLTDVMMPGRDGFGLLKELRADPRTKTTPIIMLSARAGEEARIEGLEAGADDYLIKPFSARELLARVSATIEVDQVRREVVAAKERVVNTLESITDAFITLDREWRFTYMNAEAERIGGMDRAEVLGRSHWDVYPKAVGTAVYDGFNRAVNEQVAVEFENYYEPWDKWFLVKAYPAPGGGLSVYYRDVTDRKRAAQALREQAGTLQAVLNTSVDHIYVFDREGRYILVSEGAARILGRGREEIIGRTWRELGLPPEVMEPVDEQRARVLKTGSPELHEVTYQAAIGLRHYEYFISPVEREGGELEWVVIVSRDITDRKRAEIALRDADRRKDEFLAMLAHELRNPLAAISNAAQLAKRSNSTEHREWSQEVIEAQVKNLSRMIDDLLDVSRITLGKIQLQTQTLNLGHVINSAVEAARPLIEERKHRLTVDLGAGPLRVEGDPTRLEQVFVNLLNNAAKYSESSGHITLSAQARGSETVVTIDDTGVGMTPELIAKAFDLFAQGDRTIARSEGGLGIGLTLVKNLVEMHGGKVAAESEGPGKGSRLSVRLPLAKERVADAGKPGTPAPASESRRSKILVVDDNLDTARSLAKLLKLLNNDVRTAHDGFSAIEEARADRPDVILLDIGLPGLDGYQVARRLRDEGFGETVVIAVSGYGEEQAKVRSRESGFDHHLVKPVDLNLLVAIIGAKPGNQGRVT